MSCASAGNCSAGGYYTDSATHLQALVVSETGGVWGSAEEVPGSAKLNTGNASVSSVSCASPEHCGLTGSYTTNTAQGFIDTETTVGVYATFVRENVQTALGEGWSLVANHSALSSCKSPYTRKGSDQIIEPGLAQYEAKHAVLIPWLSIWTLAAPGPGTASPNTVGLVAGKHAAGEIEQVEKAYPGTPAKPTYVLLDPEGSLCGNTPPNPKQCGKSSLHDCFWAQLPPSDWQQLVAGWDAGVKTVPGLTPAVYLNRSEYSTADGTGYTDVFVGIQLPNTPTSGKLPPAVSPNIDGYLAFGPGDPKTGPVTGSVTCTTVAADIATVAGWGAQYNTVQFWDSGVDTSPSGTATCVSG
jgi:hypothetical protein